MFSAIPVNRLMSSQFYYKGEIEEENEIGYRYLSFINLSPSRHICLFITCFFSSLKCFFKNKNGVVICNVLNIKISIADLLSS